jgi:hypothetical protein
VVGIGWNAATPAGTVLDDDWQLGALEIATVLAASLAPKQHYSFGWWGASLALMTSPTSGSGLGQQLAPTTLSRWRAVIPGGRGVAYRPMPAPIGATVQLRAAGTGRHGHGRIHIPALTTEHMTPDGGLNVTLANSLNQTLARVQELLALQTLQEHCGMVITSPGAARVAWLRELRVGSLWHTERARGASANESYTTRTV